MDETNGVPPEPAVIAPPALPPATTPEPRPWGFWMSLGWFALAYAAGSAIATILIVAFGYAMDESNGDTVAVSVWISAAVTLSVLAAAIWLRTGWAIQQYAAVHRRRIRTIVTWTAAIVAWSMSYDVIQWLQGESSVPGVMIRQYDSATNKLLLLVAVVVIGPIMEEFSIRGFLFRGWARSKIGPWGAVILTSILFGALHMQYDIFGMAFAGSIGIILALARLTTDSTIPGIYMHATVNLIASVETVIASAHAHAITYV